MVSVSIGLVLAIALFAFYSTSALFWLFEYIVASTGAVAAESEFE